MSNRCAEAITAASARMRRQCDHDDVRDSSRGCVDPQTARQCHDGAVCAAGVEVPEPITAKKMLQSR